MLDLLKHELAKALTPESSHHKLLKGQNGWRNQGNPTVFARQKQTETGSHVEYMYIGHSETYVEVDGEEIARMETTRENVYEYMNNHPNERDKINAQLRTELENTY